LSVYQKAPQMGGMRYW